MKRLQFSIDIKADKAKIWNALWEDAHYRDWTSVFFAGSHAVTQNWKEGSTVLFLTPDQNGMYSTIEKHIRNECMSFRHIGTVKNGKEQPLDDETREWSGSMEMYRLTEGDGCNILIVEVDTQDNFVDFMEKVFPKALEKVKTLAEN